MTAIFNEAQSTAPIVLVGDQAGITVIPPDTPLQRLNYFEGKFLRADDLTAEQEYVRNLAEQTAKAGGAGIAYGFDTTNNGDTLVIGPGLAFDSDGRPLLLSHEVQINIPNLIAESRRIVQSLVPSAIGSGEAEFGDCIVAEELPSLAVVQPGTTCWRISIAHAEAYCGVEDVFGRLCEDACITKTDRPYRVEGVVIRATPFPIPATPHSVVALSQTHLRSLIASAAYAAEAAALGSLISRSGLALNTWCLGAHADARPDVSLALVVRHSDGHGFLDAWSVRRERIETPAQRYWAGRMAMRPLDIFLAQVLQFQCQLHEGPLDGGPFQTTPPCAPHVQLLGEASSYLDEVRSLAASATGVPSLAGGIARLDVLREKIASLAAAQPTAPTARILIQQGFVELPSAGYLPVQPGPSPTVNDQMRALFGEGVDLRVCIARPDYIPHALEAAQHMERISLLQGLDQPDQKPRVDVLVPDGEKVDVQTRPPGRGFSGVVRVIPGAPPATPVRALAADTPAVERLAVTPALAADTPAVERLAVTPALAADTPAVERLSVTPALTRPGLIGILRPPQSAVAVNGAGRADADDSGALAFHFAGAAPAPSVVDVAALAHALAGAGSTDQSRIDLLRAVTLSDAEVATIEPAFFTRMTSLAANALQARADLLAARPVFQLPTVAIPPIVFKPPVPQHEAVVVNLWVSLRCDRNPLTLRAGESTAMQIELVLAMPSDKPSLLSYRIYGTFASAQPLLPRAAMLALSPSVLGQLTPATLLKRVRGRFSGVAAVAATIEGTQTEAHSGELELDVSAVEDVLTAGASPSLSISFSRPNDGSWLATARWGGSPLHLEIETSQQTSDQPLRLASAALDANDDVLLPGNAAHTVALSALEVIGAALGDPDWSDAHGQLLFPPAPPPPPELVVRATRDWVLFTRRREKDCGGAAAAASAVARKYQLFSVALPDSATVEGFRRALLQNDAATIASFHPTPVDVVEFEPGVGTLHTSPDAVGIDWQQAGPGGILQYGVLASSGAGDGETIAQSRLARLEQVVSLVSSPDANLVNETIPFVPAPLVVPDVDGAIILVTRTRPTTCQSVYRVNPDQASAAAALARRGDLTSLLSDSYVTSVAEADFDADTGELVTDRTALQTHWQTAGGGTPQSVITISTKGDADAGDQGARLDHAVAVATALGGSTDVQRLALEIAGNLPVTCPVITLVVPAQRTSTARVYAVSLPPTGVFTRGPIAITLQQSILTFDGDSLDTTTNWPQLLAQLQSIDTSSQLTGVVLASPASLTDGQQQRLSSFTAALAGASPPVALQSGATPQAQQLTTAQQALLTVGGTTADELIILSFLPNAVATEVQSVYLAANVDTLEATAKAIAAGGAGATGALTKLTKLGDITFTAGTANVFGDTSAARTAWGSGTPSGGAVVAASAGLSLAAQRAQVVVSALAAGATVTIETSATSQPLPVAATSILILVKQAAAPPPTRTARVMFSTPATGGMLTHGGGTGIGSILPTNFVVTFSGNDLEQDATWTSVVQAVDAMTGGQPVQSVALFTATADSAATARAASVAAALGSASTPSAAQAFTATQLSAFAALSGPTADDMVVLSIVPDPDLAVSVREVASDRQLEEAVHLYQDPDTVNAGDVLIPEIAAVSFTRGTADPASTGAADTVKTAWSSVSDQAPARLVLLMPSTLDDTHAQLHRDRAKFIAQTLGVESVAEQSVTATSEDTQQAILVAERAPKEASRLVHVVALASPAPQPGVDTPLPKQVDIEPADLTYADADPQGADNLIAAVVNAARGSVIAGLTYDWRSSTDHDASERARGFLAAVFAASGDLAKNAPGVSIGQLDTATIRLYLAATHAQDLIIVNLVQE